MAKRDRISVEESSGDSDLEEDISHGKERKNTISISRCKSILYLTAITVGLIGGIILVSVFFLRSGHSSASVNASQGALSESSIGAIVSKNRLNRPSLWASCIFGGISCPTGSTCCVGTGDASTWKTTCRPIADCSSGTSAEQSLPTWATCRSSGPSCPVDTTCCEGPGDSSSGKTTCRPQIDCVNSTSSATTSASASTAPAKWDTCFSYGPSCPSDTICCVSLNDLSTGKKTCRPLADCQGGASPPVSDSGKSLYSGAGSGTYYYDIEQQDACGTDFSNMNSGAPACSPRSLTDLNSNYIVAIDNNVLSQNPSELCGKQVNVYKNGVQVLFDQPLFVYDGCAACDGGSRVDFSYTALTKIDANACELGVVTEISWEVVDVTLMPYGY